MHVAVQGREGAEEGWKEAGGSPRRHCLSSGQRLCWTLRGRKKKAKRPSRFSPSRAVFFRRRAEVKQRLPSLSADAGVEHATRVTSREGGVIVLRAGARQKRGVKVVRGTRMQPPPQQRERERAGTRRRRPRSLHLPQRRRSTGSRTQPASQLLFPTERKRTWRDRTSVQPRRLRGGA